MTDLHRITKVGALAVTLSQGANKLVTMLGQIVLAWFLVPEDMGLVAMANSIALIGQVFTSSGVRDVLVQKQGLFDELKSAGASIGVALNVFAALLVAVIAPFMAHIYNEPRVVTLVWISVLSWPITALAMPYSAKMSIDLKFRTLAGLYALEGLVYTLSCVLLAWLGFGAYSLVMPLLWKNLTTYLYLRLILSKIRFSIPNRKQFCVLLGSSFLITLASLAQGIQNNGVNYAAGIQGSSEVVGLYYWGYSLASQSVFLLAMNLRQVFFPAFSTALHDAYGLSKLIFYWLKKLFLILMPICLLQYFLAPIVVKFFFKQEWWNGILVIQLISLALILAPLDVLGDALLRAMGKFKILVVIRLINALLVFASAWYGAKNNSINELVWYTSPAIALASLIMGLVAVLIIKFAYRPEQGG